MWKSSLPRCYLNARPVVRAWLAAVESLSCGSVNEACGYLQLKLDGNNLEASEVELDALLTRLIFGLRRDNFQIFYLPLEQIDNARLGDGQSSRQSSFRMTAFAFVDSANDTLAR